MTRWLITGASGMLGQDLRRRLAGADVTALSHHDLDIADAEAVVRAVTGYDVVVNLAAFTRVDDAETEIAEATAVNATGVGTLAAAAKSVGARFVHVSTDYVFDGTAASPYPENAPVSPLSIYGRTKAEGEQLALEVHPEGTLIVRTAWLYGAGGVNFVSTMLKLAGTHETLSVLTDQRGQPTWTVDVADRIVEAIEADAPAGIYHATNSGEASRYEFTQEIFRLAGLDPARITPAEGDTFVRPAPRPAYSVLGHDAWTAIGLAPMRPWQDALRAAADDGMLTAKT
jgi:dTDP-4-dehydrorhamnose reductase